MDDDYTTASRRGAPLIQAALALLVACTLVAFSALAFRMGFATDRGREVTATDAGGAGGAVVLPSFGGAERSRAAEQPDNTQTRIAITTTSDAAVVLGTRVDASTASSDRDVDRHENRRGAGHDKARGRGHHKDRDKGNGKSDRWDGRSTSAREEEDDDYDHGDDDASDDSDRSGSRSDGSRSGPRHRKHRDGSGSRSRGHSRGHSRGSNSN